jgi:hypothetical protein
LFEGQSLQHNPQTEGLKENIHREIENIPAEQLQRVNQNFFHRCKKCLHLAASSAPVTVKLRAVEPVNKVKILPVFPPVLPILSLGCSLFTMSLMLLPQNMLYN